MLKVWRRIYCHGWCLPNCLWGKHLTFSFNCFVNIPMVCGLVTNFRFSLFWSIPISSVWLKIGYHQIHCLIRIFPLEMARNWSYPHFQTPPYIYNSINNNIYIYTYNIYNMLYNNIYMWYLYLYNILYNNIYINAIVSPLHTHIC